MSLIFRERIENQIWFDTEKEPDLGYLELITIGRHNTWALFLDHNCYLSASCLDQVREKMRELNATQKKKYDVGKTNNE